MSNSTIAGPELSGVHIMLVEDDDTIRELLTDILTLDGAEVTVASSGNEARALLAALRPQLIISDVMMPDGDGHELLRSLQADPILSVVPFIFLTARSEPTDRRAGMNLGADDYLVKPVSRQDLIDAVRARLVRSKIAGFCQSRTDQQLHDVYARRVPAQLMTPLHTIRGAGEILLLESAFGSENRELAEMIIAASDRMARTVKRFWRLFELQATTKSVPCESHGDLSDWTAKAGELLTETANAAAEEAGRAKDLSIESLPSTVPLGEDDFVLLVRELVENAVRFSSPGSPVSVFMGACDREWNLTIQDQGCEITAADVESLKRMSQGYVDGSCREPRGMGLALVDSIARVNGLTLSFEAAHPKGLRVCVSKAGDKSPL